MRKRKNILILIALAILLIAIAFYFLNTREPVYQGKPLSKWIRGLEYENLNPRPELHAALCAMGEPAVARLTALLEAHDSLLKRKFVAYSERHANIHNRFIAPRYVIPENVYHAQAATALGEIGPSARAAIPALEAATTNHYYLVAARARAALIKIREDSVAPWVHLLEDTSSTNWRAAALTLKYTGTNGQSAVPLLIKALESTNVGIRYRAVDTLSGIASNPKLTVPALINCLNDSDSDIRREAVDGLQNFKSAKPQIVPLFLSRMKDPDPNVWLGAAFGLEEMLDADEKKTLYVPALLQSLNSPNEGIRVNAEMFLKRIDPAAAAAQAGVK